MYCVNQILGSKSSGTGMLHLARLREADLMVVSETRMYRLKQSLDQRPKLWIRYLG